MLPLLRREHLSPEHDPPSTSGSASASPAERLAAARRWLTFAVQPRRGNNNSLSPRGAAACGASRPAADGHGGASPTRRPHGPHQPSPAPPPPARGAGQRRPLRERRARAPARSALPSYWLAWPRFKLWLAAAAASQRRGRAVSSRRCPPSPLSLLAGE